MKWQRTRNGVFLQEQYLACRGRDTLHGLTGVDDKRLNEDLSYID